ncbi:MAG: fluoride efflux transporter CrcB [Exiguobacterium sp.]|uniref:fluoride efflux transporter CrcB n=1 Tax=unclassified Exiguobacterium TaxID=2644629 RepID=UPI000991140A|nr:MULTISPECIES: fluoride efflux transporter CrcB [unclassified Exiguobacterium]MBQ6459019.1 fluoride efflux transporter CrcB [Exiguobacterium sp.]MCV9900997.1 fluoride efflux transporter CrcB [Exiguobacterium sp. N5]MDT0193259.1 fluoride efflux transporter CrcB [Exiguobacterium sp. BG5(2022)]QPI67225.1 fluoride efflux transporter CrcB [Exiguobacterium sp. PBE]
MIYIYVGLAGAVGALARYGLGMMIDSIGPSAFPVSTLLINLSGSFLLGWLTHMFLRTGKLSPQFVTIVGTGMIGSFTTFSTFSVETIRLLDESRIGLALLYVFLSITLGLGSSWLGYRVGVRRKGEVK